MKYPQMDEYHLAIQNPRIVFEDPELRNATIDKDQFGFPIVRSGGFALTYHLNGNGKSWAVRCFHKDIANREERYVAISQFLTQNPKPFFVPTNYLPSGILVNSKRFPITKMMWVNGETLYRFIERNINNLSVVKPLAEQFQRLISTLEVMGVAHGDLQHGNILVANGTLILVDYDGMYVPQLSGFPPENLGHVNYQHPRRSDEFTADIDRFSAIVIYLALKAITPQLWHKYGTGENLLFKQDDFRTPYTSKLLSELEAVPDLKLLVERFRLVCQNSLVRVPSLTDFLSGNLSPILSQPLPMVARRNQYEVLDATDRKQLLAYAGQRVTIVGLIIDHVRLTTQRGAPRPYVFLSFGDWRKGAFRLVMWSETLQLFDQLQKDTSSYEDRYVSVTGLLGTFTNTRGTTYPQIVIETPSEIEILTGEHEAKERLALGSGNAVPAQSKPAITVQPTASIPVASDPISRAWENFPSSTPTTRPRVVTPVPASPKVATPAPASPKVVTPAPAPVPYKPTPATPKVATPPPTPAPPKVVTPPPARVLAKPTPPPLPAAPKVTAPLASQATPKVATPPQPKVATPSTQVSQKPTPRLDASQPKHVSPIRPLQPSRAQLQPVMAKKAKRKKRWWEFWK